MITEQHLHLVGGEIFFPGFLFFLPGFEGLLDLFHVTWNRIGASVMNILCHLLRERLELTCSFFAIFKTLYSLELLFVVRSLIQFRVDGQFRHDIALDCIAEAIRSNICIGGIPN